MGTKAYVDANTVNNLGVLYADQGRFQEAEAMYKRALKGYKKTLGLTSVLTYIPALVTLENLGLLSEKQGTIEKALSYYQLALDGAEAVWGRNHDRYKELSSILSSLSPDTCDSFEVQESIRVGTTRPEKIWGKIKAKVPVMFRP